MLNILYIVGETIPGGTAATYRITGEARELMKLGHNVTVLANRGPGQKKDEIYKGVHIIRNKIRFGAYFSILHSLKALTRRSFIKKQDVILERFSPIGGAGAILSKIFDIPLVLEFIGPHVEEAIDQGDVKNHLLIAMLKKLRDFQYNQADILDVPLRSIVPKRYDSKTIEIIEGTDPDIMKPRGEMPDRVKKNIKNLLDARKRNKNLRCFIFHGSFCPWHGAEDILPIAKKYVNDKDMHFMIVGNIPDRVYDFVKTNNLSNITLVSYVPYEDMAYYIQTADIGLTPFNTNKYRILRKLGFWWIPCKGLEYMSMEKPIVTPGHPILKRCYGPTNFFYKIDDSKALEKAIITASKETLARLHERGKKNRTRIINNYQWSNYMTVLLAEIDKAIKRRVGTKK
ncbi:hypothetical protein COT47_03855 [Candidatus Woesearchaeota archaeon CG08_land_8_20_14_0_20_43_7]|nr:MAG: hypothetical protein COT47_03855 [Candidatus Woesearchaeota archaeon CG08_land_8_20_14_0_20_43_7]